MQKQQGNLPVKLAFCSLGSAAIASAFLLGPINAAPLIVTTPTNNGVGMGDFVGYDGFENRTTITNEGDAVNIDKDMVSVINQAGAVIRGRGEDPGGSGGIGVDGNVGTFINRGTIVGPNGGAVFVRGTTGSFYNYGTIRGQGVAPNYGNAAAFKELVTEFVNSGMMTGSYGGVNFEKSVTSFRNESGGLIESDTEAAVATGSGSPSSVDSFYNAGTISLRSMAALGRSAVYATTSTTVRAFINDGTISATNTNGKGVLLEGRPVAQFTNNANIHGSDSNGVGVIMTGDVNSVFYNKGSITGGFVGLLHYGNVGTFVNDGLIIGTGTTSGGLSFQNGTVINTGTINGVSGAIGVDAEVAGSATIINSGKIIGGTGAGQYGILYAYLPNAGAEIARNDVLRLLPGSQIMGVVDFGQGTDLLDISQFTGTMALTTANLENIKLQDGSTQSYSNFSSQHSGKSLTARSGNDLVVVDVEDVTSAGGATAIADAATTITTQVSSIVSDQLSGLGASAAPDTGPSNVSGFAPERPTSTAEGAVLSALDVTRDHSVNAWATAFGGGSRDVTGAPLATVFGGIVAGSHAQFDGYTIGLLGGVVGSQLATSAQTVATTTGIVGGYARTELGVVQIDASLLGGYNAHTSTRNTGGAGTATASFSSWFLAPDIGFTLPVLTSSEGGLNVAFRAKYVGGAVSGYTETGSLANLSIGTQTVSLLDLRLELNGDLELDAATRTKVFGKAGLFGQSNLGGSTVPITILDSTFDVASSNSLQYGVYTGAGVTTAVGATTDLSASVNTSARTDGLLSASAKAQLSASF